MSDEFLVKKWDHVFDKFFDLDGSKSLDKDDFDKLVELIKIKRGDGGADHLRAIDAFETIWKGLSQYDADQDNNVSKEEWHMMWQSLIDGKDAAFDWQNKYKDFMFLLMDSSGDNSVESDEYVNVMTKIFGLTNDNAEQSFTKLGVENINSTIYTRLWNEYFSSTDQNAPGNHLFGQIE